MHILDEYNEAIKSSTMETKATFFLSLAPELSGVALHCKTRILHSTSVLANTALRKVL